MIRSAFKAKALPIEYKRRTKKCVIKSCRQPFEPRNMFHKACSPECALEHAKLEREKNDRKVRQVGLEKLKKKSELVAEAQKAFNAWIRFRDMIAGYPCISSGRPLDWSGNATDSGHYRSTGSAPHLRFNEDNCHAQSKHDNQYKSGNAVEYRIGLIARIGLQRVEALESNNTVAKWTHDELRAIKAHYMAKLKEAKNGYKNDGVG